MMPSAVILLVEDDRAVLHLATEVLTRSGFQVLSARDAEEALEVWTEHGPPDLLLTDVLMPGRTGIDLARELTERQPTLPVVFMSGYTGITGDEVRALPQGACFLQKPFTIGQLVDTVRGRLSDVPRSRRVLLVDDEAAIAVPMAHYFRQLGCTTDVAGEAEEAAALAMHNRYDVAVLDLRLTQWGGGEGLQVVDEVRRANRGAAIVVLSAFADEESEREARRRGADAVLRKPYPLPSLARLAFELIGENVV